MQLRPPSDFTNVDAWAAYMTGACEAEFSSHSNWQSQHMEADREEHQEMRERIASVRTTLDSNHLLTLDKVADAHKRIDKQNWLVALGCFGSGAGGALSTRFIPQELIASITAALLDLVARLT